MIGARLDMTSYRCHMCSRLTVAGLSSLSGWFAILSVSPWIWTEMTR